MELNLNDFNVNILGKMVSMDELVRHWVTTNQEQPASAQTCFAYYRKNPNNDEEYMHHALWHSETACGLGERKVPGYFIPASEYARFGINEMHHALEEFMMAWSRGKELSPEAQHELMVLLRRMWAPRDHWENAVRQAVRATGNEPQTDETPESALAKITTYWTAWGEAKLPGTSRQGFTADTTIPEDTVLTDAMHQAGLDAVENAKRDGCASIGVHHKVYFAAAVQRLNDDAEAFEFTGHPGLPDLPEITIIKYCNVCERPEFNGHERGCVNDVKAIPEPEGDKDHVGEEWPPTGMFQHTDGGVYEVLYGAQSSADKSRTVVYRHRWPFDTEIWTRPFDEWRDRFTPIDLDAYHKLVDSHSQSDYQQIVSERKKLRKEESLRLAQAREDEAAGLTPSLDELDGLIVVSGSVLFDTQGKQWTVKTPQLKNYKFRLIPVSPTSDDPIVWHTRLVNHEGLPVLFWNDPTHGLELQWDARLIDGVHAWEAKTAFGLLQIREKNPANYPWVIHSLYGHAVRNYEEKCLSYTNAHACKLAAEKLYAERLTQARNQIDQ